MIEERENESFDSIWDQLLQYPRVEHGVASAPGHLAMHSLMYVLHMKEQLRAERVWVDATTTLKATAPHHQQKNGQGLSSKECRQK
jgi:hypothetical protein